jgi:hypothetical protein
VARIARPKKEGHVDESVGLASEDRLHGEDVADVISRVPRRRPRMSRPPEQLTEIEHQAEADVAGSSEALLLAAGRVAEGGR